MQMNVIEGLKLQPPRASMIEARDAIILANRANFKGAGEQELWNGFAKRGMGVLAQSMNGRFQLCCAVIRIGIEHGRA